MTTSNCLAVAEIEIALIDETAYAIRQYYDPATLDELAQSLRSSDVIQPIIVKPVRLRYQLVVGSRRLRAAKKLGRKTIWASLATGIESHKALVLALAENIQREDLTPFEEGFAFLKLVKEHAMEIQDIAEELGRDPQFVRRRIQLLNAPKEIQDAVSRKKLSLAHVDSLAGLESEKEQLRYAQSAMAEGLNAEELTTLLVEEQKKTFQERAARGEKISGKKIGLRIKGFQKYLRTTIPHFSELPGADTHNIRLALLGLVEEAGNILKKLDETEEKGE